MFYMYLHLCFFVIFNSKGRDLEDILYMSSDGIAEFKVSLEKVFQKLEVKDVLCV